MEPDEDQPPRTSRTEKRRLHLKRLQAIERRRKRHSIKQHSIRQSKLPKKPPPKEHCSDLKGKEEAELDQEIQVQAIIDVLRSMERHRQSLRESETTLSKWLRASPEFSGAWNVFMSAGGISAEDFDKFLDGKFRAKHTRQKRHLRLIMSRS